MKTVQVEIPDQLREDIDALVRVGWFASEAELARHALIEFVRRRRFGPLEQFQREDIAWALQQHKPEI